MAWVPIYILEHPAAKREPGKEDSDLPISVNDRSREDGEGAGSHSWVGVIPHPCPGMVPVHTVVKGWT